MCLPFLLFPALFVRSHSHRVTFHFQLEACTEVQALIELTLCRLNHIDFSLILLSFLITIRSRFHLYPAYNLGPVSQPLNAGICQYLNTSICLLKNKCFAYFYLPITITGIQIPVIAPILILASTEPPIVGGSNSCQCTSHDLLPGRADFSLR
jgi:hypothetical protein